MTRQCVILVGGVGTRLGTLTERTPKPLLPVGGRPFLDYLLLEAARFGFDRIILLAGYLGGQFADGFAGVRRLAGRDVVIQVVVEPEPAGTGGALEFLRDFADDSFLLMNGDSWFDLDLRAFATTAQGDDALVSMALRQTVDTSRFGLVELEGRRVARFLPRGAAANAGLINAGVYFMRRAMLDQIPPRPCSLEADVFPALAAAGLLAGVIEQGFFIDIGVPADYAAADSLIASQRRRPAVFFDRDGVLNEDRGYTHRPEDLRWLRGAREAIKRVNACGGYAFVVTNQAGVARGFYGESDIERFHAEMNWQLMEIGAHVDEYVYCPYHPKGAIAEYRRDADCRKPKPGMILELMARWPIELQRSLLIGDKDIDLAAAAAVGLPATLYRGGSLDELVALAAHAFAQEVSQATDLRVPRGHTRNS